MCSLESLHNTGNTKGAYQQQLLRLQQNQVIIMSLAKKKLGNPKLVDDDLDSSSENEEMEETTNGRCNKIMMPLAMVNPRRRLVDDNLDSESSESESESESEIGNDIAPGPSTSVKISELKDYNTSEKDTDGHNDNDSINSINKSIDLKTTGGVNSRLSSTDSDSDCGGPSCNFDDSDLDEVEDKKYRPKQNKQTKTKKKTKKSKTQKSGTGSNKNPNQQSDDGEIEIKTTVPLLSSAASNSGRKNSQSKRSANQKPRQYRRERSDRNVATQKPPKIPNIPHPHGHVEVKRVTANDAIDILERMKARLAIDSDQESDNKKTNSGAKGGRIGGGRGGKEICSVLVIRKKPEYCSD